jgi:hypothetical protein
MNKEKQVLKEKEKKNEEHLTLYIKNCIDKENHMIQSNMCNDLYNYIQIYYSQFKKN